MKPLRRFAVALLGAPVACTPAVTGHKVSAPQLPPGAAQDRPGGESTPPPSPVPTTTTTEVPEPTTTVTVTLPTVPPTTTTWTTTRTTLPEYADEALSDVEWWESQEGYVAPAPSRAAVLACIRSYEGDYGTNTGNGYYGAYQFDLPTWRSVGGSGLPSDASPAEQDMRASMLIDRRGLAPWPTPNRMCR